MGGRSTRNSEVSLSNLWQRAYIGPRGTGTCQINSLKTENNTKISQRKSFKNNISQTLASLPGTQMIVQTFFWTEPKTIIIVTLLLSFLTVSPRGTLDFRALYVSLCCVFVSKSIFLVLNDKSL